MSMYFTKEIKAYPTIKAWFDQFQCDIGYNYHQFFKGRPMFFRLWVYFMHYILGMRKAYVTHTMSDETATEMLFDDLEFLMRYSIKLRNLKKNYSKSYKKYWGVKNCSTTL